jgi:hypothetical protein
VAERDSRGIMAMIDSTNCVPEPINVSYVDAPLGQGLFGTFLQPVGVQSYVRPVFAAHMAAGPDEVR